jgi:hypothetical protein
MDSMDSLDNMDNMESTVAQEEATPKSNAKHEFSATLLTEFWPARVTLPAGQSRRIYGITSDTPRGKRTRLYQTH